MGQSKSHIGFKDFEGLDYPPELTEKSLAGRRDNFYDNPLRQFSDAALLRRLNKFKQLANLHRDVDDDLLKRGALLARNSNLFEDYKDAFPDEASTPVNGMVANENQNELQVYPRATQHIAQESGAGQDKDPFPLRLKRATKEEREALAREKRGELAGLPKELIVILATCALGAIAQGWSQESIVGANLSWPVELRIATRNGTGGLVFNYFSHTDKADDPDKGLELFSIVNAIPYFAAAVFGAGISDPLSYIWGRRFALTFAGTCTLVGPIGAAYSQTWVQLMFCRFIQGIGMGAKSAVVPVLESEVVPPKLRGKLLVSWQTFVAVGIWFGSIASLVFKENWRQQIGIAFLPALPLLALCYAIPESPRWLIKKGRFREAYKVLRQIRETPLQANRDLYFFHEQVLFERHLYLNKLNASNATEAKLKKRRTSADSTDTSVRGLRSYLRRFKRLGKRRVRRAIVASSAVMIAQQFSGVNVFAFLATTILDTSGVASIKNLWFNFAFAFVNAVASGSAFLYIDRVGRRTLLLSSLFIMFPLLLLTGHYMDHSTPPPLGSVTALILVYVAVYSPGAGVIPFMYASEVFPQDFREIGMSLACFVNFSFAGGLAMAVPQFTSSSTHKYMRLLGAFAGLDALAFILVWLFMRSPEEALSLSDMNYLFGASSHDWLAFQIREAWRVLLFWKTDKARDFGDYQQDRPRNA